MKFTYLQKKNLLSDYQFVFLCYIRLSGKFVQLPLNYIHEIFHLYHRVEHKILLRFTVICTNCVNCSARKKRVFNTIFKCVSDKSKSSIRGVFLCKQATSTEITCELPVCDVYTQRWRMSFMNICYFLSDFDTI